MRAVLLDRLPNVGTAGKADHDRPLNGVKVNDAALVQALLDYGSYDAYYYVRESANNHKADSYRNRERLQALDLGSLESLRDEPPQELILFTSSHHLAKYVPFRQFCGHAEWPICGLIHGLSSNTLIPSYSWNYFSDVQRYDALICSSMAGRDAVSNIFTGMQSSGSVAGERPSCFPVRLPVIPLGIDIEEQPQSWQSSTKAGAQGFVVLCVGRFTASYKADLRPLITAFLTNDLLPDDSTLILAGDDTHGHIAAELEAFSRHFESRRKLIVMPDVTDTLKNALLKTADVALSMSDTYQETFGLSVLEAMAAGLPVVAPDWNGYRDLVEDGASGYLVRTTACRDDGLLNATSMLIDPAYALGQRVFVDLDQMMESLKQLSDSPERRQVMGACGRERARSRFSWRGVIARYEELWHSLLEESRSTPPRNERADVGFMDYGQVFSKHPTAALEMQSVVELGSRYALCRRLLDAGVLFSPAPIAGFAESIDRLILEIVRTERQVSLLDLIEALASPVTGRSMVLTQVSRLAKYGLLSVIPPRRNPQSKESEDERDPHPALSTVSV